MIVVYSNPIFIIPYNSKSKSNMIVPKGILLFLLILLANTHEYQL